MFLEDDNGLELRNEGYTKIVGMMFADIKIKKWSRKKFLHAQLNEDKLVCYLMEAVVQN